MKFSLATATFLLAALAVAAPQNRNNGNRNGGNTNANSGNTNSNSGNTNSNSGNNNAGNQTTNGGNNVDQPQVQNGSNDRNPSGTVDQQTAQLMQTAIDSWMRDTGVVSNFLNIGPNIQDETTFRNQAQIA